MKHVRYALITATVFALIYLVVIAIDEGARWSEFQSAVVTIAAVMLAANFLFLIGSSPEWTGISPGRLGRLAFLWLDAKEAELKRRTTGEDSRHNE